MKKAIWTLNIGNYEPEIRKYTYPLMKAYADKIGADFNEINTRLWPQAPVTYEKMQIFLEGRSYDWNIFIDADAVVRPELWDITAYLPLDTVMHHGRDLAGNRFRVDDYFARDGRGIGSGNWLAVASRWCLDLWHPLDIPFDEAISNIYPIQRELRDGITAAHLIDDYTCSRNIARYGLKFTTFIDEVKRIGLGQGNYFHHTYDATIENKIKEIRFAFDHWMIPLPPDVPPFTREEQERHSKGLA